MNFRTTPTGYEKTILSDLQGALKEASLKGISYKDFFQAGKSVSSIESIESVETVIQRYATAARQ